MDMEKACERTAAVNRGKTKRTKGKRKRNAGDCNRMNASDSDGTNAIESSNASVLPIETTASTISNASTTSNAPTAEIGERTDPRSDGAEEKTRPEVPRGVCLNMIVRDETAVICKCLKSVLSLIDRWVIVDTGSVDDTSGVIQRFMEQHGKPGELHHRPWVNFGHNRTEALELCRGKARYALIMDADDYVILDPPSADGKAADSSAWWWKGRGIDIDTMPGELHYANMRLSGTEYSRPFLIDANSDWMWNGVLHEWPGPRDRSRAVRYGGIVGGLLMTSEGGGCRHHASDKFDRDADLLYKHLAGGDCARNVFYLANSYKDAGKHERALHYYRVRAAMEWGYQDERYLSRVYASRMLASMPNPEARYDEAMIELREALKIMPGRLEAPFEVGKIHQKRSEHSVALCWFFLCKNLKAQYGANDTVRLFDEAVIRECGIDLEISVSAYYANRPKAGLRACKRLLDGKHHVELTHRNVNAYAKKWPHYFMTIVDDEQRPVAIATKTDEPTRKPASARGMSESMA